MVKRKMPEGAYKFYENIVAGSVAGLIIFWVGWFSIQHAENFSDIVGLSFGLTVVFLVLSFFVIKKISTRKD
ncbi:hypothetical protein GOV09_01205 [Candidatus Woesearchaeota archaeon]|nr:hypothetical protein [Candidatus Woesearchaeota archaeon]